MSNIKEVIIEGWMPFDANDSDELLRFLGQINLPANGLQLIYTRNTKYIPQENGGQYCYFKFSITGSEALSWEYLKLLVKTMLDNKCIVDRAMAKDIEEDGQWCSLYPDNVISQLKIYEPKPYVQWEWDTLFPKREYKNDQ